MLITPKLRSLAAARALSMDVSARFLIISCYLIFFFYARLLTAHSLATTPPRGWNSYDSFSWVISEEEFLQNAQIVANKLAPFDYEYVVVDFLWYRTLEKGASVQSPGYDIVDEWGRPVPDPRRWPSTAGGKGFAPIAEKVHAMGLKFGLHVMRGISTAAVLKNTPILGAEGWRAKDIALLSKPCPWMEACFLSVNTSSAGGKAFLKSLYDQYASWGVDFIKHDCVFGADNINLQEIQAVSKAILKTGRPIVYSLSPGVQASPELASLVSNVVHMYRVTGDDWDRWGDVAAHFDVAKKFAAAGLIGAPGLGGGKSWPDLDMLPLGYLTDPGAPYGPYRSSRLSLDEQKSQLTLWAMAKSPLMFGGDLRHIDETTYSLITNPTLLDINSHSSGNIEYYSGTLPGAERVPMLTFVSCDEAGHTHWTLDRKRRSRVCWSVNREGSAVHSGCFNWIPSNRMRDDGEAGFIRLRNSDLADLCFDSQPNLTSSIGMFVSKHFSVCATQNGRKAWRLLPSGKLYSENSGLCAAVQEVDPIRIWLAHGSKGKYFVAFFNLGQNSTTVFYSLTNSIWNDQKLNTECSGQEVWSRTELDRVGSLSKEVAPHGCALFSLVCGNSARSSI